MMASKALLACVALLAFLAPAADARVPADFSESLQDGGPFLAQRRLLDDQQQNQNQNNNNQSQQQQQNQNNQTNQFYCNANGNWYSTALQAYEQGCTSAPKPPGRRLMEDQNQNNQQQNQNNQQQQNQQQNQNNNNQTNQYYCNANGYWYSTAQQAYEQGCTSAPKPPGRRLMDYQNQNQTNNQQQNQYYCDANKKWYSDAQQAYEQGCASAPKPSGNAGRRRLAA